MDGITLARAIQSEPQWASMRLVLLTSAGWHGNGAEVHQAVIDSYLTKPVRRAELYNCLVTLMSMPPTSPPVSPDTEMQLQTVLARWLTPCSGVETAEAPPLVGDHRVDTPSMHAPRLRPAAQKPT